MGRKKNDGRGRMGGRQKGTPNRTTTDLKEWITDLLIRNREQIEMDLQCMLPENRVRTLSALFPYVIPKQSSLSLDEQILSQTQSLSRWIEEAPEEAIDGIAKKVLELQKINKESE